MNTKKNQRNIYLPQKAKKLDLEKTKKKAISKNLIGGTEFYWTNYTPPNLTQLELDRLFRLYIVKSIPLQEYRKLVFNLVIETYKDSVPEEIKHKLINKTNKSRIELKKLFDLFTKKCSGPQVPDLNSLKAICLLINLLTNGSGV